MGRDKARLRVGPRTLLGQIRASARLAGRPLRVIRRDLVPRCGPLGGIYSGLKTSRADAELFLACDMPFVSARLLRRMIKAFSANRRPIFARSGRTAGFPLILSSAVLPILETQISQQALSLQALASVLRARLLPLPRRRAFELLNINTPQELIFARRAWRRRNGVGAARKKNPRNTGL